MKQQKQKEIKKPQKFTAIRISHYSADIVAFANGIPETSLSVEYSSYTQASAAIQSALQNTGNYVNAYLCIPESDIITIDGILSEPMNEETFLLNVPFEFKDYIDPEEVGEYTYDYRITSENLSAAGKLESWTVSAIAIKTAILDRYMNIAQNAGLNVISAIPENQCFRNLSLIAAGKGEEHSLFVSIGFKETQVKGISDNEIIFERSIDIESDENNLPSLFMEIERTINRFGYEHPDFEYKTYITGQASDDEIVSQLRLQMPDRNILNAAMLLPADYDIDVCGPLTPVVSLGMNIPQASTSRPAYNFVKKAKSPFNFKVVLIIIGLVVVFALVAKFGVIDVIDKYNATLSELSELNQSYTVLQAQTADYDKVYEEYMEHQENYLTEEEKTYVSRVQCNEIVQKYIFPYVTVSSLSITGNTLTMNIAHGSMTTLTKLLAQLESYDGIYYASISSASSEDILDPDDNTKAVTTILTVQLDSEYILSHGTEFEEEDKEEYKEGIEAPEGDFTVDEIAWQVIRGKWGNAPVRYDILKERGYDPEEIQERVNEFCAIYNIQVNGVTEVVDVDISYDASKNTSTKTTEKETTTSKETSSDSSDDTVQDALDSFFGEDINDALNGEDIAADANFVERN